MYDVTSSKEFKELEKRIIDLNNEYEKAVDKFIKDFNNSIKSTKQS